MCPGPVAFSVFLSFLGGIWSLKLRTRHLCAFIYASHFNKAPGERCWLWFTYYYFYLVHMIHIYTTVEHKESLIETINKNWNVKKSIHIHVGFFFFLKATGSQQRWRLHAALEPQVSDHCSYWINAAAVGICINGVPCVCTINSTQKTPM